jgi:hypothetical protein
VTTELSYSEGWFRPHRRSVGELDLNAARRLHDKGKLYTVIVGEADRPFAFIEVRLEVSYLGVEFLDLDLRVALAFQFSALGLDGRRAPPGRCFLKSVIHREFDDDTDKAAFGTSYDYGFDGTCQVIRENLRTRELAESQHRVDVSAHWEALPAFGCYEPFLRRERWQRFEGPESSDGP